MVAQLHLRLHYFPNREKNELGEKHFGVKPYRRQNIGANIYRRQNVDEKKRCRTDGVNVLPSNFLLSIF